MPRVQHLELRELLDVRLDDAGERRSASARATGRERRPRALGAHGARDRRVDVLDAARARPRGSARPVAGLIRVKLMPGRSLLVLGRARCVPASRRIRGCLGDEPREQPPVLGVLLGMPLHADEVPLAVGLERLHEAVVGARGHDEARRPAGRRPGGGSCARRASPAPTSPASREPSSTTTSFVAKTPPPMRYRSVPSASGRCWCSVPPRATLTSWSPRQMREDRHPSLLRAAEQRELPRVAVGTGRVGERMPLRAVELGLHVEAPGEDEPVEPVEHRGGRGIRLAAAAAAAPRCRPTR